jgi:deoxyadenosine/deoxycytidine kinase
MARFFSLEGNIGAGKTSVLRMLEARGVCRAVYEPIDEWTDVGGRDLLADMYKDAQRHAFTFQVRAFTTRLRLLQEHVAVAAAGGGPIVFERSIMSDRRVFATVQHALGTMNSAEWATYVDFFDTVCTPVLDHVKWHYIYMDVPVPVCAQRIERRKRHGELSIGIQYLMRVKHAHDDWLNDVDVCARVTNGDADGGARAADAIQRIIERAH